MNGIKNHTQIPRSGFLLLEILVAMTIFGILVTSVFSTVGFLLKRMRTSADQLQANFLVQEGMEITYATLQSNWTAYGDDTYAAALDMSLPHPAWTLVSQPEELLQAKFRRTITVSSVTRNPITGQVESGPVDPDTKKVTTRVSWASGPVPKTVTASVYVYHAP